ncbi:hypothetical protein JXB02_06425 [Candidatus Woesearchaeota archaeon]|nr:hypothetical protein [Candidatus Woesearchaeota archaeon]
MYADDIQFTRTEILLAKHLFRHYRERYNARQLARQLSLNHAHAGKLCAALAGKGLLKRERIGNAIYYTFDYADELAIGFMKYLLSLERKGFPKWLSVLAYNLDEMSEHIELGLVFGSAIRKKAFNDIDVLLVYEKRVKEDVKKIQVSIRRAGLVGSPIRYVEISGKDIATNKDEEAFYAMLSENLIFHNPGYYVDVIRCLASNGTWDGASRTGTACGRPVRTGIRRSGI